MIATAARARKTSKKLAPAFVMTVALLVVPQGCGGDVDDGRGPGTSVAGAGGTTGNGGTGGTGGTTSKGGSAGSTSEACPATQPTSGACTGDRTCTYPTGSGCPAQSSRCEGGKWMASFTSCNPPPPPCPAGAIVEGASCPGGGFGQTTCPRNVDGCDITFVCQGTWKKSVDSCATCPKDAPTLLAQCPRTGLSCDYETGASCPRSLTCQGGQWVDSSPPCNPPPPEDPCPLTAPKAGTKCEISVACGYPAGGGCVDDLSCIAGIWQPTSVPCNRPVCEAQKAQGSCEKKAGCRWLVPGCASPEQVALAEAGCFTEEECVGDIECSGETRCKVVVTDPCAGSGCQACGQERKVCQ